jgi:hypothetical protein
VQCILRFYYQVPKLERLKSFESLAKNKNKSRIVSILDGTIATSVLFGVYHYAHSPPFNHTSMVLFLMFPSIATAVTHFLGRDIYAAVIVQNFKGIVVAFPRHNSLGVVVVLA